MTSNKAINLTADEWNDEGIRRFGPDRINWRFVCPSCGHVATAADWKDAGANIGEVAFSCIGRHLPNPKTFGKRPGPCNYAGGGFFRINPVTVTERNGKTHNLFAFADD